MPHYEPTIGLEIHAELKTRTKMFCYSKNDPDEKHPNINICPVCMGHPGTLPVINREAVTKVIQTGLALGGEIPEFSQFDRKNYFYPDLPKGYQISQYKHPLVSGGYLDIEVNAWGGEGKFPISNSQFPNKSQIQNSKGQKRTKRIRITRIHLEEDTGRLIHPVRSQTPMASADAQAHRTSNGVHDKESGVSLVDFNRAGVPLMELVTEPVLHSGEEVKAFGEELQRILRYVGVSDADMEKGQMRVEVNISLRQEIGDKRQGELGTKVEIKNINSFKYAADAVEYEIKRQTSILDGGERVVQETRGWDERKNQTFSQRKKEEAHDYRYFPEPDLPPLRHVKEFVEELRRALPELPQAKQGRFVKEYGLDEGIARLLAREKPFADYFEAVVSEIRQHAGETGDTMQESILAQKAALFLTGDVVRVLRESSASIGDLRISAENMAELILLIAKNKISHLAAKETLEEMLRSGGDPSDIIDEKGLWQMSDVSDMEDIARHIVLENPKAVEDYRNGKQASLQFLVGQVMKETRGKANPHIVQEIFKGIINHES